MKITVKKTWLGHVSVRDYIVEKAIKNRQKLEIRLLGDFMIVTPDDLQKYLTNTYNEQFKSKFDGRTYKLIDIPWVPDKRQQLLL